MNDGEKALVRSLVERATRGELARADALAALPPDFPRLAEFSFDIDPHAGSTCRVVPAAPGAATGELCFTSDAALAAARAGRAALLAVQETFPEDIEAMRASRGILAIGGGLTGHAAIVARGLGRPCVCTGGSIRLVGPDTLSFETTDGARADRKAGARVWFDGRSGLVVVEAPKLVVDEDVATLARWALDAVGDARSLDEAFQGRAPADVFAAARAL